MHVETSHPGAKGFDTILRITPAMAAAARALGYEFVVRYLGSLTAQEAVDITSNGLALMTVCFSRSNWDPSSLVGDADGHSMVRNYMNVGLPTGSTTWIDLEAMRPGTTVVNAAAYVNSCAGILQSNLLIPGGYVGSGLPFGSADLWALQVHAYWHSCSDVPNVERCGYQMYQLYPPNLQVPGIGQIDDDVIQADYLQRLPRWIVAD